MKVGFRSMAVWRRWPRTTIVVAAMLVLLVVPVYPFFPGCVVRSSYDYEKILAGMTPEYRFSVKAHFRWYGVYYWDVGGVILLRALPFLDGLVVDGEKLLDQHNAIINAEAKAAWALASDRYLNSFVGKKINGRVYTVPDHVRALRDPTSGIYHGIDDCEFMYAVVTDRPAPREYRN